MVGARGRDTLLQADAGVTGHVYMRWYVTVAMHYSNVACVGKNHEMTSQRKY